MNNSIFNEFNLTMLKYNLNICGIELYKSREKVLSHRWVDNNRINLHSGAKTFTSIAVGICRD